MNELFNLFRVFSHQENYVLTSKDGFVQIKVYSKRSLEREANYLISRLKDCQKQNKILMWIAPFHQKIFSQIDKNLLHNLVWISPTNFSEATQPIVDNTEKLDFFCRQISISDSFSIELHACFRNSGFEENMKNSIMRLIRNSVIRIKTIAHFTTLWKNNYHHNQKKWKTLADFTSIDAGKPDLFILGGPSVDYHIAKLNHYKNIWCADTALPTLVHYNIVPRVVFSLDAGHGSYEHFISAIDKNKICQMNLIIDPLAFPPLMKLKFNQTYSYANSNPLIQKSRHTFTLVENKTNDVFGLMESVYEILFTDDRLKNGKSKLPVTIGHDGGHIKKATHLRGSAYHRRQYSRNNRISTPEQYFFHLSKRYDHN